MFSSSAEAFDQEVGQPNKKRYTIEVKESVFSRQCWIRINTVQYDMKSLSVNKKKGSPF
jgi:hypothetical protein